MPVDDTNAMSRKELKILHLEDNPFDAELIGTRLYKAFPSLILTQVNCKEDFVKAIKTNSYDLIISDYNLPTFRGLDIFTEVRKYLLEIPFIFVSGTIGEERAVELMREGVTDYVIKDNLNKLPLIVGRAIAEYDERQSKKIAEILLKEREIFNTIILDSVSASVVVIDAEGNILGKNRSWERFVKNLLPAENPGGNIWSIYNGFDVKEEDRTSIEEAVESVISGDADYFYLDYCIMQGLVEKWYTIRINHFADKSWAVITQTNITKRKQIEDHIKENEEKYRSLFENMTDGLISFDPKGLINLVNPSFTRMTGYGESELLGMPGQNLFPDKETVRLFISRTQKRRDDVAEIFETELLTKSGSKIWMNVSSNPQYDSAKNALGTTWIVQDITEKKQSEIARSVLYNITQIASEENTTVRSLCDFIQLELGRFMDTRNFYIAIQRSNDAMEFLCIKDESGTSKIDPIRKNGNGMGEYIISNSISLNLYGDELENFQRDNGITIYGQLAKNWIGAPIIVRNKTIGVISCQSYDTDETYSEMHLHVLSLLGRQLGLYLERLRLNEERNKLFNLSRDLICVISKDYRFVYVNPAFTRVLGYAEDEFLHHTVYFAINEEDLKDKLDEQLQKLNKGEAVDDVVMRLKHKDGSERQVAWSATPDLESGHFFCIGRDITEQRHIQEKIEQSERQYRGIFDRMNEGLLYSDPKGRIKVVNPGLCRMLGYSEAELIGEVGYEFLHDTEAGEILRGRVNDRLRGISDQYEVEFRKKDGSKIWTQVSAAPDYDSNGEFVGVMSIVSDITARKRSEKERYEMREEFTRELEVKVQERTRELDLARAELALSLEKEKELGELKSRFVATASHQFRTPLSVIQSSMGILAMQKDGMKAEFIPRFEKSYTKIKEQITRMTDLMNDVLILGKINAGNIALRKKPADLIKLCEGITKSYREIHTNREILMEVVGDARELELDSGLLEHALSNIVSNALKYSPENKKVELTLEYTPLETTVCVKDYGMGIPADSLEHLFEPFYRASNVREISGTGLGTAIAKEYIEMNGGSIEVESEVNVGTEFIIKFKI